MSNRQPNVLSREARYLVRLKHVIFPIDFRDLRKALARNAYELVPIRGPIPGRPARISWEGPMARKGESVVSLDTSLSLVGVSHKIIEEAKKGFEELTEITEKELGINLHSNVWYYELSMHFILETETPPAHRIAKITDGNTYFSKFAKILEREVSMFSVRLIPSKKIPNQEDWFDITIEQDIPLANAYHVGVMFRNKERSEIEKFSTTLEKNVLRLIDVIEGKE